MEVLDLVPVLAAEGGDWRRWRAAPHDQHPTVEAHAIAARALGGRIRERRYLGSGDLATDEAAPRSSGPVSP